MPLIKRNKQRVCTVLIIIHIHVIHVIIRWKWRVVGMTAPVVTVDVEGKLQRLQWRPEQSPWLSFRFYEWADWNGVKLPLSSVQWTSSLRWRHDGCDGVSNHHPHDCLLNRLFRRRSKKTSKLRVTGLCVRNSPETGEFPTQMASNAENFSIWWRYPDSSGCDGQFVPCDHRVADFPESVRAKHSTSHRINISACWVSVCCGYITSLAGPLLLTRINSGPDY